MSRPSTYTAELAELICDRVAEGQNLNLISQDESMPAQSTLYKWLKEIDAFSENYEQARARRADARSDRIDEYRRRMLAGEITPDVAHKAFDMERWQAGKENPKRYGDRKQIDMDAKHSFEDLTEEQLDAEIRRRAAEAGVSLASSGESPPEE